MRPQTIMAAINAAVNDLEHKVHSAPNAPVLAAISELRELLDLLEERYK